MATLYEMTESAAQLYELFSNGDIPEEALNDTLEAMGASDKIEDYCHVINQLNSDISMFDNEIKRLQAKEKTAKNGVERMKSALSGYMSATQNTKLKAGVYSLSFRKSESVLIKDLSELPQEYVRIETKRTPDKTAIKTAIKAGQTVAGAELQVNQNLQIK